MFDFRALEGSQQSHLDVKELSSKLAEQMSTVHPSKQAYEHSEPQHCEEAIKYGELIVVGYVDYLALFLKKN